jgi:hypothetical protein
VRYDPGDMGHWAGSQLVWGNGIRADDIGVHGHGVSGLKSQRLVAYSRQTSDRGTSGPRASGPRASGPRASGPRASGPRASGIGSVGLDSVGYDPGDMGHSAGIELARG